MPGRRWRIVMSNRDVRSSIQRSSAELNASAHTPVPGKRTLVEQWVQQLARAPKPAAPAAETGDAASDVHAAPAHGIQRKADAQATAITDNQIQAALAWTTTSKIGPEAIKEIQGACGVAQSGTYDETTIRAVFAKQQELKLRADGQAGQTF